MDERLVEELIGGGVLPEVWEKPFRAVGRQEFLPDTLWARREGDHLFHPVHRGADPVGWREVAGGGGLVVTQVDDGRPGAPGGLGVVATSAACPPRLVALMLGQGEAEPGDRVLEIGTGTGWSAALLAHGLGADRVTTVEIDPGVAAHAREALAEAGYGEVGVVTGNGSHGWAGEAPYHRVVCTAACQSVPYRWVAQTRPGGRIVTPWAPEFANWALVALDVHPGQVATGAVVGSAAVMRLRDQRLPPGVIPSRLEEQAASRRATWLTPDEIMRREGVLLAMSVWLPRCQARYSPSTGRPGDETGLYLSDHRTGSWARLHTIPGTGPHPVLQGGPRRLFDELETAYQRWIDHGRPGADAWRITVDEHGQRIELLR